jgi:hypothetical protein
VVSAQSSSSSAFSAIPRGVRALVAATHSRARRSRSNSAEGVAGLVFLGLGVEGRHRGSRGCVGGDEHKVDRRTAGARRSSAGPMPTLFVETRLNASANRTDKIPALTRLLMQPANSAGASRTTAQDLEATMRWLAIHERALSKMSSQYRRRLRARARWPISTDSRRRRIGGTPSW